MSAQTNSGQELPRSNSRFHIVNIAFQITVKTRATKQLKIDNHINAVHFKFLIHPSFFDYIQAGFTTQLESKTPSGT